MIGPDMRNAIYQLHQAGMSLREISRRLQVSRNAVREIVKQQGKLARRERSDKLLLDAALLERLYRECDGWVQRIHEYGYVAFAANYYWVPGEGRGEVKVIQYADRLKIFHRYDCLSEYPLPPDGTRHQHYSPPGEPKPRHQPKNRHRPAKQEEQRLRTLGDEVSAYLDFALSAPGIQRHRFTRELFALSRKLTVEVFRKTIQRAHRYRIVDWGTLRRIAWLCLTQEDGVLPEVDVDEDFRQRPAYQEGYLTDQPDLSKYDQLKEDQQEEDEDDQPF